MESLSKNKQKYLQKFLLKRIRKQHRKCLIEGKKIIEEALTAGCEIEMLAYRVGKGNEIRNLLDHNLVQEAYKASDKTIQTLSEVETPQGVIGLVSYPSNKTDPGEQNENFLLALDSISDPGNLGAIVRTASWYAVDGILCGENCVEVFNGKVIRSSMGALFHLPVWEDINLVEKLAALKEKGYTIIGSVPRDGESNMSAPDKTVLVIGSEAKGLSRDILAICDRAVTIKGQGRVESLNAAVSSAILIDRFLGSH